VSRVVIVVDVSECEGADLGLVDALARLHLEARRHGGGVRLHNPRADLLALLDLVGLRGELDGQAEGREQLGEEEVVQPRDPIA
jgi:ABC-type transporter Mla MlaB component